MQTERVTFLATPNDKAFLARRAAEEGVSIGEYVRRRALVDEEPELTPEQEAELRILTAEVNRLVPDMLRMMDSMSERMDHTHQEVDRLLRDMGAR